MEIQNCMSCLHYHQRSLVMGRKYVGWLPFHSEGVKFDEVGWKTLGYDHIVSLLIVVCIILYPIRPHFLPFQTSRQIIGVFAAPSTERVKSFDHCKTRVQQQNQFIWNQVNRYKFFRNNFFTIKFMYNNKKWFDWFTSWYGPWVYDITDTVLDI